MEIYWMSQVAGPSFDLIVAEPVQVVSRSAAIAMVMSQSGPATVSWQQLSQMCAHDIMAIKQFSCEIVHFIVHRFVMFC